jgi:2-methylfumaryl-CoA hydratase
MSKASAGNYFEDFAFGATIRHATARTLGEGDQALYTALTGSRFVVQSSDEFARSIGYPRAPLDDLLVFHVVFGKTVPDISLNAVANLGYASCVFGAPVYPGDTLSASSTVIGLKENSNRKTGIVYVQTAGVNQRRERVLDYIRWVMVRKRDPEAQTPEPMLPAPPDSVPPDRLSVPEGVALGGYDAAAAGASELWDDYAPGERIDHLDGMTIEEAEHQLATRLYQNTARVHFNQHVEREGLFGRRIVYGGHIISMARALSFNGLAGAFRIAAVNGGAHTAPSFAGDTIYAWSEVLERIELPDRSDVGALRLRTVAVKDKSCAGFPYRTDDGKYDPDVVLDLDYTVLMPRRE